MNKEIANPLQTLIQRAAKTLPATTGKVAAQQARIDRRQGKYVILADISASMEAPAWGTLRKIDVLREAVAAALQRTTAHLIAFSRDAQEVETIPEPDANTDLAKGLLAARAYTPGVTLVISDGQPDDPARALAIARKFRGAIDVLYVGPDSDAAAIAFMRQLAAAAGGEVIVNDISQPGGAKQLTNRMLYLLPAPSTDL